MKWLLILLFALPLVSAATIVYTTPTVFPNNISTISAGTGIIIGGNSSAVIVSFDTVWGGSQYYPLSSNPAGYLTNETLFLAANNSLARVGDCPGGVVQNLTTGGVQCVYPIFGFNETDPFYNADKGYIFGNLTALWSNVSYLDSLLNAYILLTIQLYNITLDLNVSIQNEIAARTGNDSYLQTQIDTLNTTKISDGDNVWLWKNGTILYFNETLLNATLNKTKIKVKTVTLPVAVAAGAGANTTPFLLDYKVTELIVTPPNNGSSYRFSATESPNTSIIIDRDRVPHTGEWNIEKNYALNGSVAANIMNSSVDGEFIITIKYLSQTDQ